MRIRNKLLVALLSASLSAPTAAPCALADNTPNSRETPLSPTEPSDTGQDTSVPKERLGRWMCSNNRWWFMLEIGEWMANGPALIEGQPYAFDRDGWMITGWGLANGLWYYANPSGVLQSGWQWIGNAWYYLHPGGAHLDPYAMHTGWLDEGGSQGRYYLDESGAMVVGWRYIGDHWFFFTSSGAMTTGWQEIGGSWYFFGEPDEAAAGQMRTGLVQFGGNTYCLNTNASGIPEGAMVEGWVFDTDSKHYLYFYPGWGAMARSCWVDGSYVDENGFWVPDAK